MSRIVDLRHGRIGAACTRLVEMAEDQALSHPAATVNSGGAEIILFPKFRAALTKRPRKRLTRRHRQSAGEVRAQYTD